MRLELAFVSPRRQRLKSGPAQSLVEDFVTRANRYAPVQTVSYETEDALFAGAARAAGRTSATLILMDSRGQALTSEGIAERLGRFRDSGAQRIVFAIGPADGWSGEALRLADLGLSFGPITLPHELALVVLAEQVYRALTILAGHPYHSGHE